MAITADNRWNHGRSFTKHSYTIKDISAITGRSTGTIRNDISNKLLSIGSLLSVCIYVIKHGRVGEGRDA